MSTQLERRALGTFNIDPLAIAEKITGVSDSEANSGLAFIFLHERAALRKMMFGELGDTYSSIAWDEFEDIVEGFGFENIFSKRVQYSPTNARETVFPKKIIAAHRAKKLLLVASSWIWLDDKSETLNDVRVYGTIKTKNSNENIYDLIKDIPMQLNAAKPDDEWEVEVGGRNGLVTILKAIEESGCQFVDWHDYNDDGRLIDLGDYEVEANASFGTVAGLDLLRKKKKEFLEGCPLWVREFILGGE